MSEAYAARSTLKSNSSIHTRVPARGNGSITPSAFFSAEGETPPRLDCARLTCCGLPSGALPALPKTEHGSRTTRSTHVSLPPRLIRPKIDSQRNDLRLGDVTDKVHDAATYFVLSGNQMRMEVKRQIARSMLVNGPARSLLESAMRPFVRCVQDATPGR